MSSNIWVWSCLFGFGDGISMASSLKNHQNKIRSLNWYWYVINDKKSIIGRIFYTIYEYAKVSNEYMKDYDKNKKSLCLNCCDINYL